MEKLYGLPVLFSGVASLVLNPTDINLINQHYKKVLSNLLKLHRGTPAPFIYFVAGSLPGQAILHLRQLSLFSMICYLQEDPLHKRAKKSLTSCSKSAKSWFTQIRDICLQYDLPHPLRLLETPISKQRLKKLAKSKVIDYWETKLRANTTSLNSLSYFKPEFHSLLHAHPILWTAGSNPYEVSKALVQCKMLSGRYRTELLASHWSHNKRGFCLAPTCSEIQETLEHILLFCPSYNHDRERLLKLWNETKNQTVAEVIALILAEGTQSHIQFLLDPSVHPRLIEAVPFEGHEPLKIAFHLTRTWCFTIHRSRAKLLGRWVS